MFLSTATRPAKTTGRFARLNLEALEERYALDGGAAHLTINVTYGSGHNIVVYGTLSQTSTPGGQLINVQGAANGQVTTDTEGDWSLAAAPAALGAITAQKADGNSNQALINLFDEAPVLTIFDAIEGPGGLWTLQGTLTYHRALDTVQVTIDGAPVSITPTTMWATAQGTFSMVVQLNGNATDNGSVWAEATSPWGLVSNKLFDNIHQTGT